MHAMEKMVRRRMQRLEKIIVKKQKALKNTPEGSLLVNKHGNGVQYYHYLSADSRHGTYIKGNQRKLAVALAQKEYDQKVLQRAGKEYAFLQKLLKEYEKGVMEDVFEKISPLKQPLVTPVWLPEKMYIEQWQKGNAFYSGPEFREDAPEFYSDRGERMRSKSELLIANALNRKNIPYKYECPLQLNSYGLVCPDFTVLNIKERKEMYWEHLGLMDDHDYRERNISKLIGYEASGLFPGDKLILTFETAKQPLSTRQIEMNIEKYLV